MSASSSFVQGSFVQGPEAIELLNPATEEVVGTVHAGGVDPVASLEFARKEGGDALAAMTFAERAEVVGKMAAAIHDARDMLIESSVANGGTTRGGAKFDIDGASGTLGAYAAWGKELDASEVWADGEGVGLGRGARLHGRHGYVRRPGVAVFINAFNFPAWGFAEKAATAILAGCPVINKPATATSWTAVKLAEVLVESGAMPTGVFSQLLGSVTPLLEELGPHDLIAFTGSSATAAVIRGNPKLVRNGVPVKVEADSLNAAVLGPDVERGSELFQLFIRDVVREMTEKTGQKCTATRRLFVPEARVADVVEELSERLADFRVGNPATKEVTLGPVATERQRNDVHAGLDRLAGSCERVFGVNRPDELIDVPDGKGFFAGPSLFVARTEAGWEEAHREEVFGPAAVILPYDGSSSAASAGVARGGGMLVSSIYADDRAFLRETAIGIAPYCGRVVVADTKSEGYSLPTGMVLPDLLHGGPGRAGGGEELGGLRGVKHYLHRVAFQGGRGTVEKLFKS